MSEKIFVGLAWPYANGPLHVGHVAGVYLPADIFARYHRLKGNRVLMISGSDCHGTPITLCAEREGITPEQVVQRHHPSFLNTFKTLGISFDLFTQTLAENHYQVTQDFFHRLSESGCIYKETMIGSWTETLKRFLPDRYIEGICPSCGYAQARGDQCDKCGRLHDPWELLEPHSTLDGLPITFRETAHYFLDLARLQPELNAWLQSMDRSSWRQNTLQFTQNWLREGLRGRAITRDLEWGIPVPPSLEDDPAFKTKRFYVWFDAVIGYISASIEWARRCGEPDRWKEWWDAKTVESEGVRSYYFLGKDNIPFHTIVWPAMLIGYGDRVLPYDVPASEFMTLEGERMSSSRNWAIWLPDIEDNYQPDQIRYYLAANAPESRDSNWSWSDFIRRNNDELLETWGNLAHRVLVLAWRNFGIVPEPGELREQDRQLLQGSAEAFSKIGDLIERVRLKAALQEALALAQRANQYLSEEQPWSLIKTDRSRGAAVIYTGLVVVDWLKTLLCPFLPHSSQRLHELLGYQGVFAPLPEIEKAIDSDGRERLVLSGKFDGPNRWEPVPIPIGQSLKQPAPLFQKLEESVIEEERERLRRQAQGNEKGVKSNVI
jgi:methionyl-tRNA synthetase